MNYWPDCEQESEDNKQRTVGKINYINQGITFAQYTFDPGSVKYARYPKDNADAQSKEHQYYS